MARRRYRSSSARRWGGGFDKKRARPLEWLTLSGTGEDPYPAVGNVVKVAVETERGGSPVSRQHSALLFNARTDGGIITITRIVGQLYVFINDTVAANITPCMAGIQLVPYRGDTTVEPRFVLDQDDAESKEWLWRRLYPPGYKEQFGTDYHECVTTFASCDIDIKTQRRYDTGLYSLVFSLGWDDTYATPDIRYLLNLRLLGRTGTGLQ